MESGGHESGESMVSVSGWTGSEDCSGTEDRVGDIDSVLGIGVVSDDANYFLAIDGTGSGIDSFFMYGRKKYFPGLADLIYSSYKVFILILITILQSLQHQYDFSCQY